MRRIRFPVFRPRVDQHPRFPDFQISRFPDFQAVYRVKIWHRPTLTRVQSGTTLVRTRASPPVPHLLPRVPRSQAFRTPGYSGPGWPTLPHRGRLRWQFG